MIAIDVLQLKKKVVDDFLKLFNLSNAEIAKVFDKLHDRNILELQKQYEKYNVYQNKTRVMTEGLLFTDEKIPKNTENARKRKNVYKHKRRDEFDSYFNDETREIDHFQLKAAMHELDEIFDWKVEGMDQCAYCYSKHPDYANPDKFDFHLMNECPMLSFCVKCDTVFDIFEVNHHCHKKCERIFDFKKCYQCKVSYNLDDEETGNMKKKCCKIPDCRIYIRCLLCLGDLKIIGNSKKKHICITF